MNNVSTMSPDATTAQRRLDTVTNLLPTNRELIADDAAFILRPWPSAGGEPPPFVAGEGLYLIDADGRRHMDFTSGYFVNQIGHSHPRIIQAAVEQLTRVSQVGGRHMSVPAITLARKLAALAPGRLKKTLFTTGGCEANEFAIKMARQISGKRGVAYLRNAFHGLSVTTLSACGSASYRASSAAPLDDSFVALPNAYCYRCPHRDNCQTQCVDELDRTLSAHPEVGAILAEPIQGVGGLAPPPAWWERVDRVRRKRNLLLVLDEVQTGCGRAGTMFAADRYGLAPDILVLAKGISGGVGSLGAVMVTAESGEKCFGATSPTSAANAVSCAAGSALIDVIVDERLTENAIAMGLHLTESIAALGLRCVGDIRFTGLMGGIELIGDDARTPLDAARMRRIKDGLLQRGVVVTISGPLGNVVRIQPPLNVTATQIDDFVRELDVVLRAVCGEER